MPGAPAPRRAASCAASSTRSSRGTTSCGCSTTRATCSPASDLAAAAQRRVREHYAVQARLYAIAADRLRGARRLAGLLFAFVRHDIVVPVRVDRRDRSRAGRRGSRDRDGGPRGAA